jgi:hypothetical protein
MSFLSTPVAFSQYDTAATWKHKYELLELKLAASERPQSTKFKREVTPCVLLSQLNYLHQCYDLIGLFRLKSLPHCRSVSLCQKSCRGEGAP